MAHPIRPHGPLEPLAEGLWRVVGSLPIPLIPRNMFVHRLADGRLFLHSVVAMEEPGMRALEALGEPAIMIVPHPKHNLDAPFYKRRYPSLRVYGAADAQRKLPALPFDGVPESGLPPLGVNPRRARGLRITEVVVDLPCEGGRAMIFTDLVNQLEGDPNFLVRLLGAPGGGGVARALKLTQIASVEEVRGFLRECAETPDLRLVAGCHGGVVREDCAGWLRRAADKL